MDRINPACAGMHLNSDYLDICEAITMHPAIELAAPECIEWTGTAGIACASVALH
jgi:hypothetical protein